MLRRHSHRDAREAGSKDTAGQLREADVNDRVGADLAERPSSRGCIVAVTDDVERDRNQCKWL